MVSRKYGTSEGKTGTTEVIDGQELFSDSTRVLASWIGHFQKLLNAPDDIDQEALVKIQQRTINETPTLEEIKNNW